MPARPRLIGDSDRLIMSGPLEELLQYLDTMARGDRGWEDSRFIVHLVLQSGLRAAEVAKLKVGDCELLSEPYRVLVRGGKKRRADEVDAVLIPKTLGLMLQARCDGRDADAYVLAHGGKPYTRQWIWGQVKRAIRNVTSVNPKASTHTLRHVYGTRIYQHSENLLLTQRQLRHRSLAPTTRYIHLADLERETMEAVNALGLDGPRDDAPSRPASRRRRKTAVALAADESTRSRRAGGRGGAL
ncbi:MAG TPA: site-specific integrase [Thermoleophilia bacterium]|nr:site-specific integrase [Thermoleophilia bacterium]